MRTLTPWCLLLLAGCPLEVTPEDTDGPPGTSSSGPSSGGQDTGTPTVATGMPDPTTGGPGGTTYELTASNTGDTSTSTGDTSTGSTSTGDISTSTGDISTSTGDISTSTGDSSTSTGDASTSTGDTSTGDTSTSTSTGEPDTGTSTGEPGDTTTGGTEFEPFVCCNTGCTYELMQGHGQEAYVVVDGDRMITVAYDVIDRDKVILWDRLTGAVVRVERGVQRYALAGGVLQIYKDYLVRWYSAETGAFLGGAPATTDSGLASDGSYAWSASASELTIYTTSGVVLWTLPGKYVGMRGIAGALYATNQQTAEHLVIDPATGVATLRAKQVTAVGWFHESDRFWTTSGQAVSLYEPDGTLLGVISGQMRMAAHDHFVIDDHIRHVDQPGKNLQTVDIAGISKNAIWTKGDTLITIEADGLHETAMTVPKSPVFAFTRFGYEDGHWGLVGLNGEHVDDLGRMYTHGKVASISAATAGRLTAMTEHQRVHVFDVTPDCTAGKSGEFDRFHVAQWMTLADDGSVLLAQDDDPDNVHGTVFYGMPAGEIVDFLPGGHWGSQTKASDSANTLIRGQVAYGGPNYDEWYDLTNANGHQDVAPDGQHTLFAEAKDPYDANMKSYVYDANGVVQVLDGIAFGFLDSEHLLLGKYKVTICPLKLPCSIYAYSQVVKLDGTVVADNIQGPEAPGFQRVSPTEIFVANELSYVPAGPGVYNAYSGTQLWQGPKRRFHAALGADFALISDGGDLIVYRWR